MMRKGSHWYFLHFHGWLVESVQIWNTQHRPHTQDGNMHRYTIVYRRFPKQWCHQPAIEFGMMKWWTLTHLSTCKTAIQPLQCAGHIFRSTDKCLVENEDDWISILPIKRFSSWPLIPHNTPGSTLKLTTTAFGKRTSLKRKGIISQPPKHQGGQTPIKGERCIHLWKVHTEPKHQPNWNPEKNPSERTPNTSMTLAASKAVISFSFLKMSSFWYLFWIYPPLKLTDPPENGTSQKERIVFQLPTNHFQGRWRVFFLPTLRLPAFKPNKHGWGCLRGTLQPGSLDI